MKMKLSGWGYKFDVVNIKENVQAMAFLRMQNHKTVPQLYWNKTHLNKVETLDFTREMLEEELDYESYIGGPTEFRS